MVIDHKASAEHYQSRLSYTMVIVQSIAIAKSLMNKKNAKSWVKANKFKVSKVHETAKSWRFRQRDPKEFKRFRSRIITPGVVFVFGIK